MQKLEDNTQERLAKLEQDIATWQSKLSEWQQAQELLRSSINAIEQNILPNKTDNKRTNEIQHELKQLEERVNRLVAGFFLILIFDI